MGKLLRVVWNLTNRCHYNCGICAASANKRRELTLEQKQHILKNIVAYGKVNIDFSGGDPLFHPDDRTVIQSASEMLGKDNISISTTGHSLQGLADSEILSMSNNYELTYDYPVRYNNTDPRHHTYNPLNIEQSKRVKGLGADVGIFSPVQNIGDKQIEAWAEDLAELSPDSVNLIRLMPVGNLKEKPQFNEVEVYSHMVSELQNKGYSGKVKPTCAMRALLGMKKPCNMLTEKIGVDHLGNVFSCIWGADILESSNDKSCY